MPNLKVWCNLEMDDTPNERYLTVGKVCFIILFAKKEKKCCIERHFEGFSRTV